ncbi:MAG: peptidoglycan DD-metalloendopeptidase family protein [Spirochaetaceae bacterium]|nr:peptidoglycan DD-metalloendopeptidase family protein [Spirochaetaceae bacterium]
MDNLINYTQKIGKRQCRPAISKKQGKRSFALFFLLANIFQSIKSRVKKKLFKNKISYKPFMMHDIKSKNRYFKRSLKGQYIILPQKLINHVSNIIKENSRKSVLNLAKTNFFKHIKPIVVKFSIINIFIIMAGLSVFVSTSIYSSSFVPAGVITLPNDSDVDSLIESFIATKGDIEKTPFGGDIDLSLMKGLKIKEHVVAKGESISTIAKKYNVEQGTIISVNNIKNARMINAGTIIRIPDKNGLFYKVAKGDSLSSIANKYKINLNTILDINNIDSPVITPGQELFIPGAKMDSFALKKALGELFIYPTRGTLSSPYGYRIDPFTGKRMMHYGIDIANEIGTPVRATYDGKVIMCGFSSIYGKYIILKHQGTYQSLYAHLDKYRVKEGEQVVQNQIIGDMGNTGRNTGPHLHFSIYHNQQPIDPLSVLSR